MAYTSPKTWTNEPLTASDLNTYIRDNLLALKSPPSDNYEVTAGGYTTTSTSFVDVDATNLSFTLNTGGGDILVSLVAVLNAPAGTIVGKFDIVVDGISVSAGSGISSNYITTQLENCSFPYLITGVSPGTHTFKLQWKTSANTFGMQPKTQFWAREVS